MNICPVCQHRTTASSCPNDGYRTVSVERFSESVDGLLTGTTFEQRYRIERRLGEGGMGVVYLATQINVNRPVALKLLRPALCQDLKAVGRFQQEARAVAGLQHPHIVALYDFGRTESGVLYLVTEFIDGGSLRDLIGEEAPLPADRVIDIGAQIADGLVEAHSRGVIHRDLKPDNILLPTVGRQANFAKILDFGIAKVSSNRASEMTLTGTGMAVGTPQYIAPEQASAQEVSHQTDFYALGVMLYEMLTGKLPLEAESPTELMIAHVHTEPTWPSLNGQRLEGPLVDIIMQCLEKKKEARPVSGSALADLLEAAREAPDARKLAAD
ncbi:MAG: serine/threonine-protein kinase, partial [Myxococcota bacterium]|nr:serine/threonine-protein kinase [Myxococcota bacterium]